MNPTVPPIDKAELVETMCLAYIEPLSEHDKTSVIIWRMEKALDVAIAAMNMAPAISEGVRSDANSSSQRSAHNSDNVAPSVTETPWEPWKKPEGKYVDNEDWILVGSSETPASSNGSHLERAIECVKARDAQQREIRDNYELTQRIEESLSYFCDEFPKQSRPEVWGEPISHHCGGITPDDLQALLSILYVLKPVSSEPPIKMIGATCVCGREMTVTSNIVTEQPVRLPQDVLDILRSYRASCLFNAETNEYGAADGWMESVRKIDAALANTRPKRESIEEDEVTHYENCECCQNFARMESKFDALKEAHTWQPSSIKPNHDSDVLMLIGNQPVVGWYASPEKTDSMLSGFCKWSEKMKCGCNPVGVRWWMYMPKPPTTSIEGGNS